MHPGILDKAGYRLLDDTASAVWTADGWVTQRPGGGDVQDGYLFVYGQDYKQALADLTKLTGPSPLLDESDFGVWYSDYHPYSASDYENTLIPAFRANNVPLDDLSVDTDWKSPNNWNGWEWNSSLFPDPAGFLSWAKAQGIDVTLNVHASIAAGDPQLAATQAIAGGPLAGSTCFSGSCQVWDWSQVAQAESYFALHQPYESQGVGFWWLDWCCDSSTVSLPGLTPDNWINHLYAQDLANKGQRGFVLSRTGSSYHSPDEVYPAGPWSGHTSTLAFTGDTWGTWNTLAFQAQLSADEASIDEPYVSDDIGSFLGPVPGNPQDDADLYARWVQLGAFQPVLRLHSSDGNRLPWQYPAPAGPVAADFLRLREALVPYTYTLAAQAVRTGEPDHPAAVPRLPVAGVRVRLPGRVPVRAVGAGRAGHHAGQRRHADGVVPAGHVDGLVHRRDLHRPGHAEADGAAGPDAGLRQGRRHHPRAGADGPRGRRPRPRLPPCASTRATAASRCTQDAGTGTGYQQGQYSLTTVTTAARGAGEHASASGRPAAATPASRRREASASSCTA